VTVRLVRHEGEVRRYAVWHDDVLLGDVAATEALEDRLTRWGTRNRVHPAKRVTYWKATGSTEDFHTRREAVADLIARRATFDTGGRDDAGTP
jgi:hypothetical protein